jgi:hypothetical protein
MRKLNEVKTPEENAFQVPEKYKYVTKVLYFAIIKNLDLVFSVLSEKQVKGLTIEILSIVQLTLQILIIMTYHNDVTDFCTESGSK